MTFGLPCSARASPARFVTGIDTLARRLQKQGIKPNRPRRYPARVAAFRGFLKTAIGRVLNRVIAMKRPPHVVIEKLDFQPPGLSRRFNRILARSGRTVIRAKMADFKARHGITFSAWLTRASSRLSGASASLMRGAGRMFSPAPLASISTSITWPGPGLSGIATRCASTAVGSRCLSAARPAISAWPPLAMQQPRSPGLPGDWTVLWS